MDDMSVQATLLLYRIVLTWVEANDNECLNPITREIVSNLPVINPIPSRSKGIV